MVQFSNVLQVPKYKYLSIKFWYFIVHCILTKLCKVRPHDCLVLVMTLLTTLIILLAIAILSLYSDTKASYGHIRNVVYLLTLLVYSRFPQINIFPISDSKEQPRAKVLEMDEN